LSLHQHHTP